MTKIQVNLKIILFFFFDCPKSPQKKISKLADIYWLYSTLCLHGGTTNPEICPRRAKCYFSKSSVATKAYAPTWVEFLFQVLLGIGTLFRIDIPHSSVPLRITPRSCEGEMQKHGSTYLLRTTTSLRMSLKLWRRAGKLNFVWFCVYGFRRSTSLC